MLFCFSKPKGHRCELCKSWEKIYGWPFLPAVYWPNAHRRARDHAVCWEQRECCILRSARCRQISPCCRVGYGHCSSIPSITRSSHTIPSPATTMMPKASARRKPSGQRRLTTTTAALRWGGLSAETRTEVQVRFARRNIMPRRHNSVLIVAALLQFHRWTYDKHDFLPFTSVLKRCTLGIASNII